MPEALNNPKLGIISITIAMTGMAFMDALIKLLSDTYALHEIVLVRSIVGLFIILIIIHYDGGLKIIHTTRLKAQIARGFLLATANMTFYLALSIMPLANVVAIFFISPVLITALSVLILKEQVGWHRWIAVLIGFAGVAVMMQLGTDSFNPISILPLIAALTYALTQVITRKIGMTEKTSVMSFYSLLIFIFVSVIFGLVAGDGSLSGKFGPSVEFLFRPWVWPNNFDALIMISIGILIALVGYLITQAYRVAELNVIAPFEYISLPMGVFWGYIFWNDIPNNSTFLGMFLVVFSGFYVFVREQRIAKSRLPRKGTI